MKTISCICTFYLSKPIAHCFEHDYYVSIVFSDMAKPTSNILVIYNYFGKLSYSDVKYPIEEQRTVSLMKTTLMLNIK